MHCWATDKDDPTVDPVFGRVGKQKIENTGPLTTKRMETVNDEFTDAALDFIDRAHKADKPFFVWANSTRMHIFTHLKPSSIGKTGPGHLSRRHGRARRRRQAPARQARRAGHRRQHARDVLDRQRSRGVLLARWRDVAIPRREGHQLGCRVARADPDALAGRDQARHGLERDLRARGHAADDSGGRRRAGHQGEAAHGLQGGRQDFQGAPRRLQPASRTSRAR